MNFLLIEKYGKKQYDGTYTLVVNVNDKDLNKYIEIDRASGNVNSVYFNYLTVEFKEIFYTLIIKNIN